MKISEYLVSINSNDKNLGIITNEETALVVKKWSLGKGESLQINTTEGEKLILKRDEVQGLSIEPITSIRKKLEPFIYAVKGRIAIKASTLVKAYTTIIVINLAKAIAYLFGYTELTLANVLMIGIASLITLTTIASAISRLAFWVSSRKQHGGKTYIITNSLDFKQISIGYTILLSSFILSVITASSFVW